MPRSGGVYSLPAGSKAVPNTTVQSAPYNALLDDLAADANFARPVTAGGTGATNATAARASLGLAIGTDVLAFSTTTTFTRTFLDDVDAAAARATLGTIDKAGDAGIGALEIGGLTIRAEGAEGGQINLQKGTSSTISGSATVDQQGAGIRFFDAGNPTPGVLINLVNGSISGFDGRLFWNSANDGPGSALDADLLDGQHGSFYRNASNVDSGTLADARLPSVMSQKTFTQPILLAGALGIFNTVDTAGLTVSSGTGSAAAKIEAYGPSHPSLANRMFIDGNRIDFRSLDGSTPPAYINGNTLWHSGNDGSGSGLDAGLLAGQLPAYYTNINRQIAAGNGLTGGGNLAADLTVTLGAPSSVTNVSTNSVGAATHSHALGFVAAEVYTGNGVNDTAMAVGHVISAIGTINRNALTSVWLDSSTTTDYRTISDGAQLAGTYRGRGRSGGGNSTLQRTA